MILSAQERSRMISPGNRIPAELREAVNLYLSARLNRTNVISTSAAAQEARISAPGCRDVPERELVDYIAGRATEAGFAVSFDGRELAAWTQR
jgi:hypothetical protein